MRRVLLVRQEARANIWQLPTPAHNSYLPAQHPALLMILGILADTLCPYFLATEVGPVLSTNSFPWGQSICKYAGYSNGCGE